jgi:hypothetical protein
MALSYTQIIDVPVPHGHEAEAEKLVSDLRAQKLAPS